MGGRLNNPKYSISHQSQAQWCSICKTFVQPSQKRTHEQSEKHKDSVERKMKEIAQKTERNKAEDDRLKRQIEDIERKAMQKYSEKDINGGYAHHNQSLSENTIQDELLSELRAKEEMEFRLKQKYGNWVFDDRTKYYWHGVSSTYFDPKSAMFFNNITKQWSKNCPENAPPAPATIIQTTTTVVPQQQQQVNNNKNKMPYNSTAPTTNYSNSNNNDNNSNNSNNIEAQKAGAAAIAAAGLSSKVAPVVIQQQSLRKSKKAASSFEEEFEKKRNNNKMSININTNAFNLGYGSNHPAYEAAKAKTQAGRARAFTAAGGKSFNAKSFKDNHHVNMNTTAGASGKVTKKKSKGVNSSEEKKALDAREAAQARIEARAKKAFGLI